MARREPPAGAEREHRWGEVRGTRHGHDVRRPGRRRDQAPNQCVQAVGVHPALLERAPPPAHVRNGEWRAPVTREHDRARAGTPRKRPLSCRAAPALLATDTARLSALLIYGVNKTLQDHRTHEAASGDRVVHGQSPVPLMEILRERFVGDPDRLPSVLLPPDRGPDHDGGTRPWCVVLLGSSSFERQPECGCDLPPSADPPRPVTVAGELESCVGRHDAPAER